MLLLLLLLREQHPPPRGNHQQLQCCQTDNCRPSLLNSLPLLLLLLLQHHSGRSVLTNTPHLVEGPGLVSCLFESLEQSKVQPLVLGNVSSHAGQQHQGEEALRQPGIEV